jgi:hypothetical protein
LLLKSSACDGGQRNVERVIVHVELSGGITRSDSHQGVHGVRVKAWDAGKGSDPRRDIALTNRDGSYWIDLRSDGGDTSCCDCPNIEIELPGRDCRPITLCATPAIEGVDRVLHDSWRVPQGDPWRQGCLKRSRAAVSPREIACRRHTRVHGRIAN